jgi:N-acetylmuramoyl-L-alanine amidase
VGTLASPHRHDAGLRGRVARARRPPRAGLTALVVFATAATVTATVATSAAAPADAPIGPIAPAAAFVVAIDPGHGGSNLGAVGPGGLFEKDVTLALVARLRARLAGAPGVRVVVCRDADVLVPIRARARCAAEAHAQLFVSVHANTTPPGVAPGSERGFELYVLPPEDVEDDATLAALGARGADAVWAAHLVRAASARSLAAAVLVDRQLRRALGADRARGIRETGASLDVLRGTGAPSVLVEVGFVDNAADREILASEAGQDRIAGALADAVLDARAAAAR